MRRCPTGSPTLLFVVICAASGCSGPADDAAAPPDDRDATTQTGEATTQAANGPASNVRFTLPDLESGTTHVLRAEGRINAAAHDLEEPFEFEIPGRMSYRVRITCRPFVQDDWCINPLVDITHASGSRMHAMCYAAFFNEAGELVGCCGQGADMQPSATPLQLGSLVIRGTKERLLTATRFQIVIYESDQHIGSEPVAPEAAKALVGRDGEVISRLQLQDSNVSPAGEQTELRLEADLAFDNPADKTRNTHLGIKSAAEYDLYLSTRKREVLLNYSNREDERFERWESDVEFDQRRRVKGVSTNVHAALLDESGQLVVCSSDALGRQLAAPEDVLLSARQLVLVAYESVSQ